MFEERLAVLFRGLDCSAEIVGSSRGDYGGDLIVAKDRTKTVVRAKCWKKNGGVKAGRASEAPSLLLSRRVAAL